MGREVGRGGQRAPAGYELCKTRVPLAVRHPIAQGRAENRHLGTNGRLWSSALCVSRSLCIAATRRSGSASSCLPGLALLFVHSQPGAPGCQLQRSRKAPSTRGRGVGLETARLLFPMNVQTWVIPCIPFSETSGGVLRTLIFPPRPPHQERSGRGGARHHCCACQGLALRSSRDAHTWTLWG